MKLRKTESNIWKDIVVHNKRTQVDNLKYMQICTHLDNSMLESCKSVSLRLVAYMFPTQWHPNNYYASCHVLRCQIQQTEFVTQHSLHWILYEWKLWKRQWNIYLHRLFYSFALCLIILWVVCLKTGLNYGSMSHNYAWSCNMENAGLQHLKVMAIS